MISTHKVKERIDLAAIPRYLYSEAVRNIFLLRIFEPFMHANSFTNIRFIISIHVVKKAASSFCFNIESYPTATLRRDVTRAKFAYARTHVRGGTSRWESLAGHGENITQIVSQTHSWRVCGGPFTHVVRSPGYPSAAKSSIADRLSLRNAGHVSAIPLPRSPIQPHHRQRRRVYANVIANAEQREYNHPLV